MDSDALVLVAQLALAAGVVGLPLWLARHRLTRRARKLAARPALDVWAQARGAVVGDVSDAAVIARGAAIIERALAAGPSTISRVVDATVLGLRVTLVERVDPDPTRPVTVTAELVTDADAPLLRVTAADPAAGHAGSSGASRVQAAALAAIDGLTGGVVQLGPQRLLLHAQGELDAAMADLLIDKIAKLDADLPRAPGRDLDDLARRAAAAARGQRH